MNYWNIIIWISIFGFCLNPSSFLNLLFFSEVTWLTLYTYSLVLGVANDELTILSTSFLILGLASLEFSIGLMLIILFKNFFQSINLYDLEKSWSQQHINAATKMSLNKHYWKDEFN